MKKELVAGQIGCGGFARQWHGRIASKNPHISRIKWACDISGENAKSYAREFNAEQVTSSFMDVLTDPEVDIVLIATSHSARVPIIETAAQNGKHVFCEKPLAVSERDCYDILRALKKSSIKLCVNYNRRSAPAMVALKREWLKHRENPRHQPWQYIENPREKLIEEKITDFLIRIQDESSSFRMVHLDPYTGGGLIIGEAVHWVDLPCWLFDSDRPVEIHAWGSARMRFGIYLSFQSGNAATITSSPNGSFDYPKEMYEIACGGALFRMESYVENQYYGRPGIEREFFPPAVDAYEKASDREGLAGYLEKHNQRARNSRNLRKEWNNLLYDCGVEESFNGFVNAVLYNTPVPCDAIAGYRATYLANLAMKSIEVNHPLPVAVDRWDMYVEG